MLTQLARSQAEVLQRMEQWHIREHHDRTRAQAQVSAQFATVMRLLQQRPVEVMRVATDSDER
eukprot:1288178-Lingulodinium_polyedra.AAC.1